MERLKAPAVAALACAVLLLARGASAGGLSSVPEPDVPWAPRTYLCPHSAGLIAIDGVLAPGEWGNAPWTQDFVDIEGGARPAPRFRTRAKMLWDGRYLYVAAELQEPDVWATLRERDSVVYHDNDFEMFIDPDGDTHEYYELEVNAFATAWDLLLVKPYRDGGPAVDAWDIQGLRVGVAVDGTLNTPGDSDMAWTVELAIPWTVLDDCAHRPAPPSPGDQWRVNFSRVEWRVDVRDGRYVKATDPEGRPLPEDNWVWSPQGLIAMHYPEMWGFVEFDGQTVSERAFARMAPEEEAKWTLRRAYYRERNHFAEHGAFTSDLAALGLTETPTGGEPARASAASAAALALPSVAVTPGSFEAWIEMPDGKTLHISEDGHVW